MAQNLTLETIKDLDGGSAGLIVNSAIRRAIADLEDRGDDNQARKVSISLSMKRMDNGQIAATVEATAVLPKYKTKTTVSNLKVADGKPTIEFQPGSPGNPDQRPLFGEEHEEHEEHEDAA